MWILDTGKTLFLATTDCCRATSLKYLGVLLSRTCTVTATMFCVATPHHATSHYHDTPHHTYHTIPYYTTPHTSPHHTHTPYLTTPHLTTPHFTHHSLPHHTTLHHTSPHHTVAHQGTILPTACHAKCVKPASSSSMRLSSLVGCLVVVVCMQGQEAGLPCPGV